MVGKFAAERAHQRLRSARLADRDGVDPEEGRGPLDPIGAEALADLFAVERLGASAPPQSREREGQRSRYGQRVEQPHCSARSTSAGAGARPSVPTLVACFAP